MCVRSPVVGNTRERRSMVFQGIEKSLQGSRTSPIFGVQMVSSITVLAARESDPSAGSQSNPWHERLSGVAFCAFQKSEEICAF